MINMCATFGTFSAKKTNDLAPLRRNKLCQIVFAMLLCPIALVYIFLFMEEMKGKKIFNLLSNTRHKNTNRTIEEMMGKKNL